MSKSFVENAPCPPIMSRANIMSAPFCLGAKRF